MPPDNRGGWAVAKPTEYAGVRYPSKGEANEAARLDLKKRAGRIRDWSRAPAFPLVVNGQPCGRYTPDFLVHHLDGTMELLEVKGRPSRDFVLRFRTFKACYPERWITVLDSSGRAFDPLARRAPQRRFRVPR